jgi:hypothetical protein
LYGVAAAAAAVERKKKEEEEEEEEVLQQTKRGVRDVPDAVQRTKSVCLDPFASFSFCVGRGVSRPLSQGYFLIN